MWIFILSSYKHADFLFFYMQAPCGGDHMLVLALPRPPEDVPEMDILTPEDFLDSKYTELLLLDTLIGPNALVPLPALAARARHREKVRAHTHLETGLSLISICGRFETH